MYGGPWLCHLNKLCITEKIIVDSEFGGGWTWDISYHFMGSEDVGRVIYEVSHRN